MVKKYGMYGEGIGFAHVQKEGYFHEEDRLSNKLNQEIDNMIKNILKVF
jgi:ATP-dependent Zn protease